MSPEAPKPDTASTQTGSDIFKEGIHPTDRVAPFTRELSDVSETLIGPDGKNIPNTVRDIDTDSLDVDFDKLPPAPVEKKTHIGRRGIAGAVASLLLAAGVGAGVAKGFGGDSPEGNDRTTVSASNPVENEPTKSLEGSKGEVSIIGVESIPSPEQIAFAAENPILVEGSVPTAEGARAAYEMMGEYENIYMHSATFDGMSQSEASLAAGEAIKDNLYGPEGVRNPNNSIDFEELDRARDVFGASLASEPERLKSYGHWEAGSLDQVEELTIDGKTVWKMPYTEYNEGNWDIVGDTPERKNIMTGTVFISTYETSDGKLAWYHYDGMRDSTTVVSDTEVSAN